MPATLAAFWSAAFLSAGGAIVLISLAWKGVGRLRFVHSSVNRQVAVAALAVSAWTIAQRGLAVLSGVAASTQYMLELCAFTVLALLVGNFLGKRLSWAAVAYAAGTIASRLRDGMTGSRCRCCRTTAQTLRFKACRASRRVCCDGRCPTP